MKLRGALVVVHRYVGLVLAGFLLLAGLTGAILVWYHELDHALNAKWVRVTPPGPHAEPLDPLTLREKVQAARPDAWVHHLPLQVSRDTAVMMWLDHPPDQEMGRDDQVFVDPYTGEILGSRRWGDLSQGLTNLMPFLYRLHYQLALGTVGTWIFGVVALLWALDCFVGAWLTLPPPRRGTASGHKASWWLRWTPAWTVRLTSGAYKLHFDLHRAGGLWPWALLFVLAWSSVGLNLQPVYRPVMGALFEHQPRMADLRPAGPTAPTLRLDWAQALARGEVLMAAQARTHGFQVIRTERLSFDAGREVVRYSVVSDRDITHRWGATAVYFDARTGEHLTTFLPSGKAAGDTVTGWLYALHFGAVGGWPYRLLLTVIGLGVVMLSVTGVYLWWKKRRGRQRSRASVATIPATGTASAPPAPIPAAARAHPEPPHAAPGH